MLAKSGRVNPLASAPAVASLLTGACCDSGEINWESSIWTWESDSTQASVDISRTEIWEEISETNWRQCSIAERSLLLPNFILNLLLSFCGERKTAMLEPDKFYIITQKKTVKTRLLLHGPASSSGASFFARQRRARNEWLVMNRKEPWEGYRRQAKLKGEARCLLPAFLCAHIFIKRETSGYEAAVGQSLKLVKLLS